MFEFVIEPEPSMDIGGGKNEPGPRFIVGRETRRQEGRRAFVGECEPFHHQFGARHRLDPQALGQKTFVEHRGNKPGVDHGRFSHARFAVKQGAAINRDQANEPPGFVAPLEKDRAIDETELLDAAKRLARPVQFRQLNHTGIGVFLIAS